MTQHQEIEIKFRVDDLEAVRRRLVGLGAERIGAGHEENLIFDDAAGDLRATDRLLRLRRDQRVLLTVKTPVADPQFKVRRELEVEVSDFDTARALLEALGYRVVAGYEKDRETWRLDGIEGGIKGALVLLDRLSIGSFVEVEGEPRAIERVAALLGFDLAQGITKSYLDLMAER